MRQRRALRATGGARRVQDGGKIIRPRLHGFELRRFRGRAVVPSGGASTVEATEREAILRALLETNWVLGGPHGAAARLGLKRTTLQSRIQKLGIDRSTA